MGSSQKMERIPKQVAKMIKGLESKLYARRLNRLVQFREKKKKGGMIVP